MAGLKGSMKQQFSVTIRMGAPYWDATIKGQRFDFRTMSYDQKKLWYGAFMDGVRTIHRRDKKRGQR